MNSDKARQEASLLGRFLSMATVLVLVGIFFLGSGIMTGATIQIFWGVIIIGGAIVLHFVRKKDWQKHWAEREEEQRRYQEALRRREEEKHDQP